MKFQRQRCSLLCLTLLTGLLAGCGYHFPGSRVQVDDSLKNSTLKITGKGATASPQLTFLLRDTLRTRLGLTGEKTKNGKKKQTTVLRIVLEPMKHTLVAEDRSGRANQYRVTVRAKPIVVGLQNGPTYASVQGVASYYEPIISTSVQATRNRAEEEALEQLAATLVAVLSGGFQP